ncbi:MAG TPA: MFS transporter, partial [Novosphingobium sp.]
AASASAHAPASYSLLADAFPPRKLTRAFALLQFGFIGGTTLGPLIGGKLVMLTGHWAPSRVGSLEIFGWQWIMIWTGLPAILVGLLFLTVKEPPRAGHGGAAAAPPAPAPLARRVLTFIGWDAMKAIHAKPRVYYPLFGALALSAVDVFGLQFWRTPFMIRTYHWNEGQIGSAMSVAVLTGSLAGLLFGGIFVEWLARRHGDANVRATTIFFAGVTVCTIAAPLMPIGEAAIVLMGISVAFGIAGAVPQNAAIQRVAPNAMRGQVTAIYLFMFTFFGAMGSFFVGLVQDLVVRDEGRLWLTLVICGATLLPLATLLMARAIRPYREEIERLEALERPAR